MEKFRVLARELAVEEVSEISGANPAGNYTTLGYNETGSGGMTSDDSYFTIYDQGDNVWDDRFEP